MAKTSEAQRRAVRKYAAENVKQIRFEVNKNTETDVLERLESAPLRSTYIKELIRADIQQNPHRFG